MSNRAANGDSLCLSTGVGSRQTVEHMTDAQHLGNLAHTPFDNILA